MAGKFERTSDVMPIVGVIDPDANVAGDVSTAWVNMADYGAIMAIVMGGDLGTAATLDAKIEQASDGSGTGVKAITGKAITQLTKAGTDDNKQAIILVEAEDLDRANAFTHVRLTMTTGTATSDSAGIVLGVRPYTMPATDLTTVDEYVG